MARKLRIQYSGALYHVINRGNYRRDLFESAGEAEAFLATVKEAKERMGWRVHAYVLMRNHYHLALETPEPTLVEGMHWLQSTWATRFNRYRQESGHLFQGRYKAMLVEDIQTLGRAVDYIHLNPVRAKIVVPEQVRSYRWSSLPGIVKGRGWVDDDGWRATGGYGEGAQDRRDYEARLIEIGREESEWKARGLVGLSKGWALGTSSWRKAMAEEHGHLALAPGLQRDEILELRQGAWERAVQAGLKAHGKREDALRTKRRRRDWKLELASTVRKETGASVAWLASRLEFGQATSLRSYLSRHHAGKNQQTAA